MSLLLCIETSADPSVAGIVRDERIVAEREIPNRDDFARTVESMLRDCNIAPREFAAIAIGCGPGSFTGLRVGYAFAKGFAFGVQIPVWPVSSLQLVAANARLVERVTALERAAGRNSGNSGMPRHWVRATVTDAVSL